MYLMTGKCVVFPVKATKNDGLRTAADLCVKRGLSALTVISGKDRNRNTAEDDTKSPISFRRKF